MEKLNSEQLKCINTLISKLQIDKEHKVMMVQGFTGGRETSTTRLYFTEAGMMIKHLKKLDPTEAAADKMRKKIIGMAHEMGWETSPGKADMKRLDDWCKKFGYKHKSLDNHTYHELPALVTQFMNGPYKHHISNI
jgi:hypothetical protein